jgi:hypothetical protein
MIFHLSIVFKSKYHPPDPGCLMQRGTGGNLRLHALGPLLAVFNVIILEQLHRGAMKLYIFDNAKTDGENPLLTCISCDISGDWRRDISAMLHS